MRAMAERVSLEKAFFIRDSSIIDTLPHCIFIPWFLVIWQHFHKPNENAGSHYRAPKFSVQDEVFRWPSLFLQLCSLMDFIDLIKVHKNIKKKTLKGF